MDNLTESNRVELLRDHIAMESEEQIPPRPEVNGSVAERIHRAGRVSELVDIVYENHAKMTGRELVLIVQLAEQMGRAAAAAESLAIYRATVGEVQP